MKGLLQRDPSKRLGSEKGDANEIKSHPFFNGVDWNLVMQKKNKMPTPIFKSLDELMKVDENMVYNSGQSWQTIEGWSFVKENQQDKEQNL